MPTHAARKRRGHKRKLTFLHNARVKQIEERMEALVSSHDDYGRQAAFNGGDDAYFFSPGDDGSRAPDNAALPDVPLTATEPDLDVSDSDSSYAVDYETSDEEDDFFLGSFNDDDGRKQWAS